MIEGIRPLTDQEQVFFECYCRSGDAKESAMRAGLADEPEKASRQAAKLLKSPHIQAALKQVAQEQVASMEITGERIMREYAAIGFSDIADFVQEDESPQGDRTFRIRDPLSVDPLKRGAIKKITEKPTPHGLESSIELHSKLPALDKMTRAIGLGQGRPGESGAEAKSGGSVAGKMSASESARIYLTMKDSG